MAVRPRQEWQEVDVCWLQIKTDGGKIIRKHESYYTWLFLCVKGREAERKQARDCANWKKKKAKTKKEKKKEKKNKRKGKRKEIRERSVEVF